VKIGTKKKAPSTLWPDEKRGKNEKREKNYFLKKERKSSPNPCFFWGWEPSFPEGPILATRPL
jgi:hypothetical protein